TPTSILKLRGSKLVTAKREAAEVKGPGGMPERPPWLDAEAKAKWDQLVPRLQIMRVLTLIDEDALTQYCRLWSRWRKAEDFIEKNGEMFPIRDDAGKVKCFAQWPQVAIAHRLVQQLIRLEQEFGMTPAARTRIHLSISPPTEADARKARYFTTAL
ncbi:MAG: phage terminase small subunit P27 family, partial [Planctomycetota bacterium]